jgi:hypothetical protein
MYRTDFKQRLVCGSLLLCLGVVVSGTKACQENYDFAGQASVTPDPSAEPTSVEDTATETPTETATGLPEDVDTPTPDASIPQSENGSNGDGIFTELSSLVTKERVQEKSVVGDVRWRDADNDGYSDELEKSCGTDPSSSTSVPSDLVSSSLSEKLEESGLRLSDLTNEQSKTVFVAVGSAARGIDSDGDGVPDLVEESRDMSIHSMDTDSDGLRDDRELVIGSDPLSADSDLDGISDMQEILLGSNPTIPER